MTGSSPLVSRVLDLSRGVAGAYTTRLLADLGARCSRLRWQDDRPGDWPASPGFRAYFDRGVELVPQPETVASLLARLPELAASFDLVLHDLTAAEAPELTEDVLYAGLRPYNPSVVVANVTHFGRSGPYARWAGDELTDYALGGYWSLAGDPERAPLRVPGYQAQFHAGMQLAIAAIAALRYARQTGQGQEVEVSAVEAMVGAHWSTTVAWTHEGRVLKRVGSDIFPATDGHVFFFTLGLYPNLFVLIEQPELMEDPRWSTITAWIENGGLLWSMVREWCARHTVDEIVNTAQELRIPATPVATAEHLLRDPHWVERGTFERHGGVRSPRMPYHWNDGWQPADPQGQLAAGLRQPSPAVVAQPVPITSAATPRRGGPLAGLRVLEVTNNWAGPIAGRHLADLGAEVLKVELASKSATRLSHYPGKEPGKYHWNRSGYFNEMNRNKRDVAMNLATPRGRDLFLELVKQVDIVLENNSARVMPNLGLGYEPLSAANPRLIMASISGFGASGPHKDWVAFGSNIEASCGLAATTGYDETLAYRTGSFVPDPIAGGHATVGILAALERRDRTGQGAHLDISLTESAMPFMLESIVYYQEQGALFPRRPNYDPDAAPTGAYRCFGTDEWVAIAVRTDEQWAALCRATGIDGDAHSTMAERVRERAAVDALVSAWTATQDQYECVRTLQGARVPAAPILHNWQLHSDPQLYARDVFIPIEHPDTGVFPYPGFPWRLTCTQPEVRTAAPRFAEANDYVFGRLLGRSAAEIEALYADGATAHEPEGLVAVVI